MKGKISERFELDPPGPGMRGLEVNQHLKPFLKWAGGKRWFVANYSNFLPNKFKRYIEPFLGSGAVFFYLRPQKAILGDCNPDLIDTYRAIKETWQLVYRYLADHHRRHSLHYYYRIRSFQPKSLASRAARFIYLNRTCWNGLYRVNQNGVFNVPIGTKSSVIFDDDCFEKISEALQVADLHSCDFEYLIDMAEEGDFVFVDPPYTVRHNHNGFIKYNEDLFSWLDQERLFCALNRAKKRGVHIVGTNAYHQSLKELYKGIFKTLAVKRSSCISSKVETRNQYEELVILNGVQT